jgi:hypothetical protein
MRNYFNSNVYLYIAISIYYFGMTYAQFILSNRDVNIAIALHKG